MQLKTADDRAPDIDPLEALRRRPAIDARTARMIEDEIWSIRLGAKAESDAAYQLDFDLKDSAHWAVIHDLRLDIEGQIAQIDHLVISRMLEVFVCESKSYSGRHPLPHRAEPSPHRGPGARHHADVHQHRARLAERLHRSPAQEGAGARCDRQG